MLNSSINLSLFFIDQWGLYVLTLVCGVILGFLYHYLYSYSARSRYEADERRKSFHDQFPIPDDIEHIREWLPNERGVLLYRHQLIPKLSEYTSFKSQQLNGVIGIVHGFMDHTSNFHTELAIQFCRRGYAVVLMDAEGHGLSDGVYGYIRSIDDIVDDFSRFLLDIKQLPRYVNIPLFLYGESMGGAVSFNLCTKSKCQDVIQGAVLVAPMLKISDEMMIPRFIIDFCKYVVVPLIPYAPIAPVKSILHLCFKKPETLYRAQTNSLNLQMKPRLGSALAMIEATEDISTRLHAFRHSVLIIHGGADNVTDPSMSSALYDACQSEDKVLKIYPGCLHGLMKADDEPMFPEIFRDVVSWLESRGGVVSEEVHTPDVKVRKRRTSIKKKRT